MAKVLTAAAVDRLRRDGFHFPISLHLENRSGRLSAAARGLRGREWRGAHRGPPLQDPPPVQVARGPHSDPASPRHGRGSDRPRHPVLDHALVHQGAAKPPVRFLAPGQQLLGPRHEGPRQRVGGPVPRDHRERVHAPAAREPPGAADAARRHLCRGQHVDPGPDDPRRRREPGGERRARDRRRRPLRLRDRARLPSQPERRPAHRRRAAIHAAERAADPRGLGQCGPRRGEDRYGHFEHEPVPSRDLDPVAVAFHRKAEEQQRQIYFRGTAWQETRVSPEGVTAPY